MGRCHVLGLELKQDSNCLQVNHSPGQARSWEQSGELASRSCFLSACVSSSGEGGSRVGGEAQGGKGSGSWNLRRPEPEAWGLVGKPPDREGRLSNSVNQPVSNWTKPGGFFPSPSPAPGLSRWEHLGAGSAATTSLIPCSS